MKYNIIILLAFVFNCFGMPQFLNFPNLAGFPMMDMPDFNDMMPKFDNSNKVNKTTNTKKLKDGTKVTTTNINGPNFMLHEESAIKTGKSNGKGGEKLNLAASFDPFLLKGLPIAGLLTAGLGSFGPKNCKPKCKKGTEYCNEDFGKCLPRMKTGFDCQQNQECQSGLFCVWGICNEAKSGEPGTICKKTDDCQKNTLCWSHEDTPFSKKHCLPKLSEGAACGAATLLSVADKSEVDPCGAGLKCSAVGYGSNKICVKTSYKGSTELVIGNKNGSEGSGDEAEADDGGDDDNSGDDNSEESEEKKMPVKTADGETIPGSNKKNKNKGGKKTKSSTTFNKKKDKHLKFKKE